jgi:hypothetical protein
MARKPYRKFTDELGLSICKAIAIDHLSTEQAAAKLGIHRSSIYDWVANKPPFRTQYEAAQLFRFEAKADALGDEVIRLGDESIRIADDPKLDPDHKRVQVNARQGVCNSRLHLMSKWCPRKYGARAVELPAQPLIGGPRVSEEERRRQVDDAIDAAFLRPSDQPPPALVDLPPPPAEKADYPLDREYVSSSAPEEPEDEKVSVLRPARHYSRPPPTGRWSQ